LSARQKDIDHAHHACCRAALTLASPAAARDWMVDKAASRVGFQASVNGPGDLRAVRPLRRRIFFDPADLKTARVAVAIDMASAESGDPTRDQALPSGDWFAASRFARATFVTRSITARGPGAYVANGVLTIRGVARPVALPFTLAIRDGVARMNGRLAIDRNAFGVGQGQWQSATPVALNVIVAVQVTARAAAPAKPTR
jgi:polyisoprenoid-binding protein YceI